MAEAPYALVSLIDNDQRLYRMRQHADKQLALKKARGVYDRERARSAYTGLVELLAKDAEKALADYEERTPRPWHVAWSKAERDAVERELVGRFENAWASPKSEEHKELIAGLPTKFRGGRRGTQLSERDVKARRRGAFTLAELEAMPVMKEGHTDNLVLDTGKTRVWLSRLSKEDGAPYDNQVTVEARQGAGKTPEWKTLATYKPKGQPLAEFLLPEREAARADARAREMYPGKRLYVVASHHPGQYLLRSTDLTRTQLLKAVRSAEKRERRTPGQLHAEGMGLEAAAHSRAFVERASKHERGQNPHVSRGLKTRIDRLIGKRK